MKTLSKSALNVSGQPMFRILDKAEKLESEGKKIIHFELGEPQFDTPKNIVDAAIKSLQNGDTHYVNSYGKYSLREMVQDTTFQSRDFKPDINQILVTPGANAIIFLAMSCLVNPGDEIIIPDPGFPTYISTAKFIGAKIVTVPLHEDNAFRLNPDDLRSKITSKTRLIIINSPSNPTGSLIKSEKLIEIAKIAEEKDIYILSDEVYARMVFGEPEKFFSIGLYDACKKRTIIANGFSKAFAMTGWRLGVAIGPADVIEKMMLVLQTINSCVPPFIQEGGIEAIRGDKSGLRLMMEVYEKNRDYLVERLNLIKGITCLKPDGAIYVFANIKETGMSSEVFADYLLDECGIAVLPGNNFGNFGEGYIRLSYTISIELIKEAIEKMKIALGTK